MRRRGGESGFPVARAVEVQCPERRANEIRMEVERDMSLGNVTCLSNLAPAEIGIVASLSGGRGLVSRLAALGITPGAEVNVIQNFGRGPIIVRVRNARIALGRGEAMNVQVRKQVEGG